MQLLVFAFAVWMVSVWQLRYMRLRLFAGFVVFCFCCLLFLSAIIIIFNFQLQQKTKAKNSREMLEIHMLPRQRLLLCTRSGARATSTRLPDRRGRRQIKSEITWMRVECGESERWEGLGWPCLPPAAVSVCLRFDFSLSCLGLPASRCWLSLAGTITNALANSSYIY